jgi:hypothetical protein
MRFASAPCRSMPGGEFALSLHSSAKRAGYVSSSFCPKLNACRSSKLRVGPENACSRLSWVVFEEGLSP